MDTLPSAAREKGVDRQDGLLHLSQPNAIPNLDVFAPMAGAAGLLLEACLLHVAILYYHGLPSLHAILFVKMIEQWRSYCADSPGLLSFLATAVKAQEFLVCREKALRSCGAHVLRVRSTVNLYWQRSPGSSFRAMADEERWQRFGEPSGEDAESESPEGQSAPTPVQDPQQMPEHTAEGSPWWLRKAASWAQQGWSEEAIWEYLLQRTEGRESEDWRSEHSSYSRAGSGDGEKWWGGSWLQPGKGESRRGRGWHDQGADLLPDPPRDQPDPWARALEQRRRSSGAMGFGSGAGDLSDKPTEKIPVPSFSGQSGEEGEIGSAARSYLRKVEAWERVTRLPEHHRGVALYSALKERVWVEAEALDLDRLSSEAGVTYFKAWIRERFMDIEVTQVGHIMSQFFRVRLKLFPVKVEGSDAVQMATSTVLCLECSFADLCGASSLFIVQLRRSNDQSVRSFSGDFDRMVSRLAEVQVTLPETVLAWMFIDKLRLDEAGEISLLASVRNEYRLKLLQEAALIHDRPSRKPWEESRASRHSKTRGVHLAVPQAETEHESELDEGPQGEGGGAPGVTDRAAPQLEHQRGSGVAQGAARSSSRGSECAEGAVQDDTGAAHRGSPPLWDHPAGEAHQRRPDQDDPGPQGGAERHRGGVRPLPRLGVLPAAGGLPGLGPERVEDRGELQRRPGTPGAVVAGAEANRRKAPGLLADDPEMTATVPPPPFAGTKNGTPGAQVEIGSE